MMPILLLALLPAAFQEVPSEQELLVRALAAIAEAKEHANDPTETRAAYIKAAECYEQLHERGCRNTDLYRNLGNAYYLGGKLPEAIFAYRRGRALDPDDRGSRESLDYARSQIDFSRALAARPPADDWPPWLPRWTPRLRLLLGAGLLAAFWITLTRYRMTQHGIHIVTGGLAIIAGLFLLVSVPVEHYFHQRELDKPLVVVRHDGVDLRTGDGDAYPPRDGFPALRGGTEAELLAEKSDIRGNVWLRIQLAGGDTGWIREADALVDGRP